MELLNELIAVLPSWLDALTSLIGSFALIAALTPTKRDDSIVGKASKVVDFLGANFGNAKNK